MVVCYNNFLSKLLHYFERKHISLSPYYVDFLINNYSQICNKHCKNGSQSGETSNCAKSQEYTV